jgi:hypothetical protein
MQKFILLVSLALVTTTARPQSILDLTEQIALDVQKLSSIKSTLNDMIQGYDNLKAGYTRIRDIVRDNFQLHQSFLDALWILSPTVRGDPRLMTIINTAAQLVTTYKTTSAQLAGNPVFTAAELSYITGTLAAVLGRCTQAIEELTMVTTDNELRMSDAQRLQALDRIDAEIRQDAAFLQRFSSSLSVETARRQREANDINTLKTLYGLPN